jgi:hypothetical protein
MDSTVLLDLLCNVILIILNTCITLFFAIYRSLQRLQSTDLSNHQLLRLQASRSLLVIQQEEISRWLEEIDTSIQHSEHQSDNTIHQQPAISPSTSPQTTPLRSRQRMFHQNTSSGHPYPLPFNPPRTPEEVRSNNIVAWLNNLHNQYKEA